MKKISTRYRLFCTALVASATVYLPAAAFAALPVAATVAPGVNATTPGKTVRDLFTQGITLLASVLAAAIVLGGMWQIYSAYVEGRKKGELKDVGITAAVGLGIMAGGVILALLAVQYGTFT
ncbi:MAG: hypothetical protein L3K25_07605 [Gammaproteobacteria bacterium]|nr:hypothetical protein [Gammaproteobacteria bacterium]